MTTLTLETAIADEVAKIKADFQAIVDQAADEVAKITKMDVGLDAYRALRMRP